MTQHSPSKNVADYILTLRLALESMVKGYGVLLQRGHDRIVECGGQCDSVEIMEAGDMHLRRARVALAETPPSASLPDMSVIKAVIAEMCAVATKEADYDPDDFEPTWTAENRERIDQWQGRLRDALASVETKALADRATSMVDKELIRDSLSRPWQNGDTWHCQCGCANTGESCTNCKRLRKDEWGDVPRLETSGGSNG